MTSHVTINGETFDLDERDRVIEQVWPYDGPHDQHSVATAAASIAALVRYLNNATQPHLADHTLPYAATISDILNGVRSAAMHLDQLLDQLDSAINQQATTGDVYDADLPDVPAAGRERARALSAQLAEARQSAVQWDSYRLIGGLTADLDKAAALASGIGNRTDEVPG